MEEKPVRKTTVKKAVRRTTTKVAPRKTAVKKTAATTAVRKAPARSVQEPVRRKKRSKAAIIVPLLCLIVVGASVAVGYTDKGQLTLTNVNSQSGQPSSQGQEGQEGGTMSVPVQDGQNNAVNGGLVGAGKTPQEPAPVVVEQASSTENTASSTEAVEAEVEGDASAEEPAEEGVPEAVAQ
jgi:hypothetical protein